MCGCRSRINAGLESRNARLASGFTVWPEGAMDLAPVFVTLEKINPRGKKPPTLLATFCPFCGEKYNLQQL